MELIEHSFVKGNHRYIFRYPEGCETDMETAIDEMAESRLYDEFDKKDAETMKGFMTPPPVTARTMAGRNNEASPSKSPTRQSRFGDGALQGTQVMTNH